MGDIIWAYFNSIRVIIFCMDAIRGIYKAEPMRDDELFKRRRSDAIYQFDG